MKKSSKARQAKALRKRHARKASAPNPVSPDAKEMSRLAKSLPQGFLRFSDEDYMFWLAHGVNYLASNYEEGIWAPIFDGIYDGVLPTGEELAKAVLERYGEDPENMPPESQHVLSWTVQDKEVVYLVQRKAVKAIKKAAGTTNSHQAARLPMQPAVWETFEEIRA